MKHRLINRHTLTNKKNILLKLITKYFIQDLIKNKKFDFINNELITYDPMYYNKTYTI